MGWCSATLIFDAMVGALLDETVDRREAIKQLIIALEDGDWDCQFDSAYIDHPIVDSIFRELHPPWYEGDE